MICPLICLAVPHQEVRHMAISRAVRLLPRTSTGRAGTSTPRSICRAQACEAAKVYCTGYHVDMKHYAPESVTVSYMWNWAPIFEDIVMKFAEGGAPLDTSYYWGAQEDCATISAINTDIVPADVAVKVEEVHQQIESGELGVLAGEIKDNEGNVIVKAGEIMPDDVSRRMDFLVENVIGQLP